MPEAVAAPANGQRRSRARILCRAAWPVATIRQWLSLPRHPSTPDAVDAAAARVAEAVRPVADRLRARPDGGLVIGTSKTFKQLARMTGAARQRHGRHVARRLTLAALREWIPRLTPMSAPERAALPGVAASRSRQILAGAVIAATLMEHLDVAHLDVCPWALREGILFTRRAELTAAVPPPETPSPRR